MEVAPSPQRSPWEFGRLLEELFWARKGIAVLLKTVDFQRLQICKQAASKAVMGGAFRRMGR